MGHSRTRLKLVVILGGILLLTPVIDAAESLRGVVQTSDGTPLAGVVVTAVDGESAVTDEQGRFVLQVSELPATLRVVEAGGDHLRTVTLAAPAETHRIVIPAAAFSDRITVVATPSPSKLSDTAASVQILDREALDASAAATLDDMLRQVPGFTLFRRTGSRTANPTAQGVSLRGIGASGASRSLVLYDGFPLNDPFGGWIYWGSVPREAIDRVEVVRGGVSDLYGSGALAGVVGVVRRNPSDDLLSATVSAGSDETAEGSLFWTGEPMSSLNASLALEGFTTAGYIPVSEEFRGAADQRAASERWAVEGGLAKALTSGRLFGRLSYFDEERDNGTVLQMNETSILRGHLGADGTVGRFYGEVRAFATDQDFHQTFSAVSDDRDTERLVRVQDVPSRSAGVSLRGSGEAGRMILSAGADVARVEGRSIEAGPPFTAASATGGVQTTAGVWVNDEIRLGDRTTATLALRADFWSSEQTHGPTAGVEREDDALSPRLALVHAINDRWTASATGYRSFRAPTLNELYRGFRVGNVVTGPNAELGPERLTGYEIGTTWLAGASTRARVVAYQMTVHDPVANFTLSVTPELVTRQRRNLGETRTRGVELDVETRRSWWSWSLGYLLSDARVIDDGVDGAIEGNRIPQIPRHQITAQVTADWNLWSGAVQARWSDSQWEDDRNQLLLEEYGIVDLRIDRAISSALSLFLAAENVLDEEYAIGRAGEETLGQPRSVRLGMRYSSR